MPRASSREPRENERKYDVDNVEDTPYFPGKVCKKHPFRGKHYGPRAQRSALRDERERDYNRERLYDYNRSVPPMMERGRCCYEREYSAPRYQYSPPRREYSPPRYQYSPPRREYSPPRYDYSPPRYEYCPPSYVSDNFRTGLATPPAYVRDVSPRAALPTSAADNYYQQQAPIDDRCPDHPWAQKAGYNAGRRQNGQYSQAGAGNTYQRPDTRVDRSPIRNYSTRDYDNRPPQYNQSSQYGPRPDNKYHDQYRNNNTYGGGYVNKENVSGLDRMLPGVLPPVPYTDVNTDHGPDRFHRTSVFAASGVPADMPAWSRDYEWKERLNDYY